MKKTILPAFAAAVLLLAGCTPYSEQVVRGTLYTDSTMTTPIAGDTLTFRESTDIYSDASSTYLGQAVTDAQGRWGFQYIRGYQNPYMQQPAGAKLSMVEYFLLIIRGSDTLYWNFAGTFGDGRNDTLTLWPGKWQHPDWWDPQPMPDTTAVDTTNLKGGLL